MNNNLIVYNILNKENEFLRNKIQILNQQNTSLYEIIHNMKELMIKFNNFPKVISYYENEIKEKNNEILDLKKKFEEEFYKINDKINQQIEKDNNEKRIKDQIIDGLKKTIEEIENQKYIDSNEYENQLFDLKSKIKILFDKEKQFIKKETELKNEKDWIINTKNDEITLIQNSKSDIENQLNDLLKENESLKKQNINYQQTIIKTTQQQQQQRHLNNNNNNNNNNSKKDHSFLSMSSSSSDDHSKTIIPINTSNHLSNKKPITATKKTNWEY